MTQCGFFACSKRHWRGYSLADSDALALQDTRSKVAASRSSFAAILHLICYGCLPLSALVVTPVAGPPLRRVLLDQSPRLCQPQAFSGFASVLAGACVVRGVSGLQNGFAAVYVLDPKILFSSNPSEHITSSLQDRQSHNAAAPYVPVIIPQIFVSQLSQGVFHLGEMDDPGNSWVFGEEGELFEHKLLGAHKINSGYTSIITAQAFDEIQQGSHQRLQQKLPSWSEFVSIVTGDMVAWPHPKLQSLFLFAGAMVESDVANVYRNPASGSVLKGLVISTSAEGVD